MLKNELCKMYREYMGRGYSVHAIAELYQLHTDETIALLASAKRIYEDKYPCKMQ